MTHKVLGKVASDGLPCCCGRFKADHPNTTCGEWHWYEAFHHHTQVDAEATKAAADGGFDLLHLLALKAVWPRGAGSRRFKTELHLDRAIEQHLEKLNPGDRS